MQIIQTPGNPLALGAVSASGPVTLVTAGANVRGVILKSSVIRSYFTAVNGIASFFVFSGPSGLLRGHGIYDSIGATGPLNAPQTFFSDKEIQFPAGFDVTAQFSITNALINYTIMTLTL